MTDADLDRIALALGLELPAFYRGFMLDYPRELAQQQPEWSDVERGELADDPDRVIHFNRYVREAEPGEFFEDRPWPEHYFVIGSEEEQNWNFLDLAGGSEAVYQFHHEEGEVRQLASSLRAFPAALIEWWEAVTARDRGESDA